MHERKRFFPLTPSLKVAFAAAFEIDFQKSDFPALVIMVQRVIMVVIVKVIMVA